MLRIRIRIHRIHVLWASWILLSLSKNSKKNHDFYCFVTFWLFNFEKWSKSTFKEQYAAKLFFLNLFLLASWRSMMKIEGSGSGSTSQRHGSAVPDGSAPKSHGSATLVWMIYIYNAENVEGKLILTATTIQYTFDKWSNGWCYLIHAHWWRKK